LADVEGQIRRLEKLLAGPFAEKAPPEVVQKERNKLANYRSEQEELRARLADLE
jgi:valyl-tRNA synthetase